MSFQDIHATLTITNAITSGACFAVQHGTGAACYVPATVVFTAGVKPGDVVDAVLVPNPSDEVREKTPYLVRYIDKKITLDTPKPQETLADKIAKTLREGGVWTANDMYSDLTTNKPDTGITLDAVADALGSLFDRAQCAKFVLWRQPNTDPAERWYTCYPDKADVDEWQ